MTIMKKMVHLLILVFSQTLYSQNSDSIQINVTSLDSSIYVLSLDDGGNIGILVGDDGILMIDTHRKQFIRMIQEKISEISPKHINIVINTHWHFDHVEGNETLGRQGSLIIAHDNTRDRLSVDQSIPIFMSRQESTSPEGLPKLTFPEAITLYMNNEIVDIFHIKNAHTNSDLIIHFKKSNVFHMGDIFVRYGIPFIDVPNGGTMDGMISACEQIIPTTDDNSKIIPGHGQVSTKHDLIEYTDMLKTIRNRIVDGIKKGNTIEQIIESNPAAEFNSIVDKGSLIRLYYDSFKYYID
jgi:cyclase